MGAALFDLMVISVPAFVLAFVVFGSVSAASSADDDFGLVTLIVALIAYVGALFAAARLYAPLLMRREGAIVPLLAYVLDGLWPLWDDEHRAVHDMVVGTRVVEA